MEAVKSLSAVASFGIKGYGTSHLVIARKGERPQDKFF
jgi:hypothetical protein